MPLDAILLTALRRELENSLLGAKIDRISMPEKDVLILSVHSREQGSRRVLISVRRRRPWKTRRSRRCSACCCANI